MGVGRSAKAEEKKKKKGPKKTKKKKTRERRECNYTTTGARFSCSILLPAPDEL
jgi:hypothetical protein